MYYIYRVGILLILCIITAANVYGQIPNVRVTNSSDLQNEVQITYCPADTSVLIAVCRDMNYDQLNSGIARSTDGGASWFYQFNQLTMAYSSSQSDPTVTADAEGNLYCCFLDFRQSMVTTDSSFLVFVKSTDYGQTWQGPFPVSESHGAWFEDKEYITVDRTGGPYHGNVYVAWTRFDLPARIFFAISEDGAETWSDSITVAPPIEDPSCPAGLSSGHFPQPIVGADGSIYIIWSTYNHSGCSLLGRDNLAISKSTDGGLTWSNPYDTLFHYNQITFVDGAINVYTVPVGDADISDGPYDGNLYISFLNGTPDGAYYHGDVLVIRSTDGGGSWSEPMRINDDPMGEDVDQFHPWLIVNQDGVIITIFYDQRVDPAHYNFDVFATYSFDGGETFTSNHRITDVSSSPDLLAVSSSFDFISAYENAAFDLGDEAAYRSPSAGKIAEYIGVTSYHDAVTAAWTDSRNANSDIYSATYTLPFLKPRLWNAPDGGLLGDNDSLFWSTCWHESGVSYRIEIDDDPLFGSIDINGNPIDNKLYSTTMSLTDGIYFWRVKAFRTTEGDSTEYSDVWSFEFDTQAPSPATPESPGEGSTSRDSLPTFDWSTTRPADEYFEIELSTDPAYSGVLPYLHYEGIDATSFTIPDALSEEETYYWHVNHYDLAGNESGYSSSASFNFVRFICGDANGDLAINVGDAVHLINYVFKGGDAPDPMEAGEVNCDGALNVGDAVYVINYVFKGGDVPCAACP
ncbi:MAG: hypothetical protein GY841_01470 [FCB group bacterium]|nr:hypothetical protein [FCB group bacterium]